MGYIRHYRIIFYSILYFGILSGQVNATSTITENESSSIQQQISIEHGVLPKININKASAQEIAAKVKGVGLKKAQAVIDYREKLGAFKHVEELLEVKGIGVSIFELNRDHVEFILEGD